jgi:predicted MPP superfamily phosphohydrolase
VFLFLIASRYVRDIVALSFVLLIQTACAWNILRKSAARPRTVRMGIVAAWALSMTVVIAGFFLRFSSVGRHFPEWVSQGWGRGSANLWAFYSVLLAGCYGVAQLVPRPTANYSPARRIFLQTVRGTILGAPAVTVGYGTFVERFRITVREQNIPVPDLPKDLEGLRIAQLTDIHMSPFLTVRQLEQAVGLANETRPHLTLVTGDLITTGADPLDDCLRTLAGLKADVGVYGCMGNHEIYAESEAYTQSEGARLGMHFLRQQSALLRFGGTDLNLVGVDYQHFKKPYLVRAESLAVPGVFNVLLSHNPDVFPVAAAKGFPLTISGHTHGGQVRFEILRQDLNVARFFTHYVDGLYRKDGSSIFVSRGIGTIAVPSRLGAPPEVALLKLCRT